MEFIKGIYFKQKSEKAPDYVIGKLSINRKDMLEFLNLETDDWINGDILISKAGKPYIKKDEWKPKEPKSDLPF